MSNPFETVGREKKAAAIADYIKHSVLKPGSMLLWHNMIESDWLRFAQAAGYKRKTPPSTECRRMVIAILKGTK